MDVKWIDAVLLLGYSYVIVVAYILIELWRTL